MGRSALHVARATVARYKFNCIRGRATKFLFFLACRGSLLRISVAREVILGLTKHIYRDQVIHKCSALFPELPTC